MFKIKRLLPVVLFASLLCGCGAADSTTVPANSSDESAASAESSSSAESAESESTPESKVPDGVLRIGITDEIDTMDVHKTTADYMVPLNIYERLFDIEINDDGSTRLIPALAESWSVSKNGRTYRFVLRDDAFFSDGTRVTSEDVAFSFTRMLALPDSVQSSYADMILGAEAVMNGEWVTSDQFCFFKQPLSELWNKNLHIVGLGKIGRRVAAIAGALGMKVSATVHSDPGTDTIDCFGTPVRIMSLKDGLRNADVISLHCPLTDETKGLINGESLKLIKPSAFIINCARGPLVDEDAVAGALKDGRLAGYAADVISVEPMLPSNPLLGCPNVNLTPHIAWAPQETRIRLIEMAAENLKDFMAGGRLNRIV